MSGPKPDDSDAKRGDDEVIEGEIMPSIVVLPEARQDWKAATMRIAQSSQRAAERFVPAVVATFESLAAMPGAGTLVDLGDASMRGLRRRPVAGFPKYLVFYRPLPNEDGIEVVRVLHGSRDVQNILRGDGEDGPPALP